jgi:hypothetical protein
LTIESDLFNWRALGHWESSAAKARFTAFVLWHVADERLYGELAQACGQGGDAGQALFEAFHRESAVALELVVKAVIARELREQYADPTTKRVPYTHNLPRLWRDAGLPTLSSEDQYRLELATSVLNWSGRYATPTTVKAWEGENQTLKALEDRLHDGERSAFHRPITITWAEFDRLYQIAHSHT